MLSSRSVRGFISFAGVCREIGQYEAHLSAEPTTPEAYSRVSETNEHKERPSHLVESPRQGT